MYTQCDNCLAVETTMASIGSKCMHCGNGFMKVVNKPL